MAGVGVIGALALGQESRAEETADTTRSCAIL